MMIMLIGEDHPLRERAVAAQAKPPRPERPPVLERFRLKLRDGLRQKRLFELFSVGYYRANVWRGGIAIIGIALGVAVLYSMNAATFSAFSQFKQGVMQIAGETDYEIAGAGGSVLNEAVLEPLYTFMDERQAPFHYSQATPILERPALILDKKAAVPTTAKEGAVPLAGQAVTLLGVDMFHATRERDLEWKVAPELDLAAKEEGLLALDAAAVSEAIARKHRLEVGDTFRVVLNEEEKTLKVAGIFKNTGSHAALRQYIFMDIAALQTVAGVKGQLSRIDVDLPALTKADRRAFEKDVKALLPAGAALNRPQQRSENIDHMVRAYQVNLMALSFITLVVATFLIYNTLSMAVLQRRQDIGTYRLLGLERLTLRRFIQLEALGLGAIGSFLGLLLGSAVLPFVGAAISATLQSVYTGQSVSTFFAPGWLWPACLGVGLITSLLGAYFPTQEALKVQPVECVKPVVETPQNTGRRRRLAILGLVFLAIAGLLSLLPPLFELPLGGYAAAFFILAGGTFITPLLLDWNLSLFKGAIRLFQAPTWMRIGAACLQGGMHRASVAVASLMVALSLTLSLATLIGSFRSSVENWIHQSLRADIFVQPMAVSTSRGVGMLSESTVRLLSSDPDIRAADPFLERQYTFRDKPFYLGAANLDTFANNARLTFTHGEDSSTVLQRVKAQSLPLLTTRTTPFPTIISEPFANKHGLKRGDTFSLPMPKGTLHLRVEGIYYDYASSLGYAIIHRPVYAAFGGSQPQESTNLALYLKPGANADEVIERLQDKIPPGRYVSLRSNKSLREEVLRIFDKTFAITYLMQSVAILISILTVLHALTALIIDGKRIYATLDYMGMRETTRKYMVVIQGVGLAAFGYTAALIFGLLLSIVLIYVLNAQSFGWSVPLLLPWGFIINNLVWVLSAGAIASIAPLWVLRRNPSTQALRYE
jgi:putative ABC transport system permease protein